MQILLIFLTVSLFLLAGCSNVDRVETVSTPTERTPLNIDPADPVDLKSIEWIVVTPDNVDNIMDMLEQSGNNLVVFGITPSDYEDLSMNMSEIRNHINTQRRILLQYKIYYEGESSSSKSSD